MGAWAGLLLRFLETLLVCVWLGGITILSGLVAPTLFAKMPTRAQAGEMFGHILTRFYCLETGLAVLLIMLAMLRWKYLAAPMGPTMARVVLVALMLGATLTAQFYLRPHLKELRTKIGNFESVPADDPNRILFGKLHQQSVMLMGFNGVGSILLLIVLLWKA